jgi:hypothetical protein
MSSEQQASASVASGRAGPSASHGAAGHLPPTGTGLQDPAIAQLVSLSRGEGTALPFATAILSAGTMCNDPLLQSSRQLQAPNPDPAALPVGRCTEQIPGTRLVTHVGASTAQVTTILL